MVRLGGPLAALLLGVIAAEARAQPDESRSGGARIEAGGETGPRFALEVGGRFQARLTGRWGEEGGDPFTPAIRRARVDLEGFAFHPAVRFDVQLALSPADLGLDEDGLRYTPLLDATLELAFHRDVALVIGQSKRPFARERIISSAELALVDRSIVDGALGLDRDLGVMLRSRDFLGLGRLRYAVGVGTGEGREGGFGEDGGLAWFGRVELLPFGLFDDGTQADLERSTRPRLALGAAYAFLDRARGLDGLEGPRPVDGGTTDIHAAAFDVLALWRGWTLEADLIWRRGRRDAGDAAVAPDAPRNGVGAFLQIGALVPGVDLELVARVGALWPRRAGAPATGLACGEPPRGSRPQSFPWVH